MANNITDMNFKNISIKSFISDLPNIFNENFMKITDFINSIYDFTKKKLHNLTDIDVSGTVTANTIKAKNLLINGGISSDRLVVRVKDEHNEYVEIDLLDLKNKVDALYEE